VKPLEYSSCLDSTLSHPAPHVEGSSAPATIPIRVEVIDGADRGVFREFSQEVVTIGTQADADLKLRDPTVSRRHLELHGTEAGVLAVDLGSRNGTRVNGVKINESMLPGSCCIDLGATRLLVRSAEGLESLAAGVETFGEFVTANGRVKRSIGILRRAATSLTTVLIEGETGTGKEVLARAIHDASPRKRQPYVIVDCAAITPTLLDSHLFGHVRGSFTGAVEDQVGALARANGGTVFIDEIGELPAELQPKLLRALEARTIQPIGSNGPVEIDVRFIAATNRKLQEEVAAGRFRQDLYFRLAVVNMYLPPLRDREEDLVIMATRFLEKQTHGDRVLSPAAYAALTDHDWPGNARELRNTIERASILSPTPVIQPEHLFPDRETAAVPSFHHAKERIIGAFERHYVEALLRASGGNVSQAAKMAGLSRASFYDLMSRTGLRR
jgi:DNA-binding NtrC family response regulator